MKRGRQGGALKRVNDAAGLYEIEAVVKPHFILDPATAVEVEKAIETTQQHVLAIIDTRRVRVARIGRKRRRSATKKWPSFVNVDLEARLAEFCGRGESGEAAADDLYAGNGSAPPSSRSLNARTTIQVFSQSLSRTR